MKKIYELLTEISTLDITDLFLSNGLVPYVRKNSIVSPYKEEIFSEKQIEEFRKQILSTEAENIYQKNGAYDIAFNLDDLLRFRLNFYSTLRGSSIAIRPVKLAKDLDFSRLNLPKNLINFAKEARGLLLIAGTTGCGKSTTLATIINYINNHYNKHILSIEDPVEFIHQNNLSLISQREVNINSRDFHEALKNAMRENPDVIIIGEMRDTETMQAAINAALTGHLVISTVHTADAVQAIERIINLFPEEHRQQLSIDLSNALIGIVAQRLLPNIDGSSLIPAVEIMQGTPTIKKLIADRRFVDLEATLREGGNSGMISFTRSLFSLLLKGTINVKTALEFAGNRDELMLLIRGMENGVDAFRNHYGERDLNSEEPLIDMATLLRSALKMGSSDLILSVGAVPSVRLNGEIRNMDLPILQAIDAQRLLYSVITPHQRVFFEEYKELDFALTVLLNLNNEQGAERNFRFRVNAFFQRGNIGIVSRIINDKIPKPKDLLLPSSVVKLADKKQGLVLITGPTGSGKTTTLASLIDHINCNRTAHIITIEDPIEYIHENINSIIEQRELHSDTKNFATALKYTLRQDPDVILVGEMRDIETMQAAITAAETGHLVFATIHTNDAPQTIDRIVDSFPDQQQNQIKLQLAGVILGVISQRLLNKADGQGRVAAFEVMLGSPAIKAIIRDGKTHQLQSTIEISAKDGMITLEKALDELHNQGLISKKELQSYKGVKSL